MFSGGFAGKCFGDGQWDYNFTADRWECTKAAVEEANATITTNFYRVPPDTVEYKGDNIYAGFQINASEIQKYNKVYENASITGTGTSYRVDQLQLQVQCGQGKPYGDAKNQLLFDQQYARNASIPIDPSTTTQVIMKLPVWNSYQSGYQCAYGFQQYVQGVHTSPGNPDFPIPKKTYNTWKHRGGFNYGNWNNYNDLDQNGGYIIEGLNDPGSINSGPELKNGGRVLLNPTDLAFQTSNYQEIRNQLANKEIKQERYTDQPFTNFPEGGIYSEDVKNRNPLSSLG